MATSRVCSILDCGKPHRAHGWCVLHYKRWLRHGDPCAGRVLRGINTGTCTIPACGKKFSKRGWCAAHYQRWRTHGDPLAGGRAMPKKGAVQAFLNDLLSREPSNVCVRWPFGDERVHGTVWLDGRTQMATRIVCERAHGNPPTAKHHAAHSCGKGHERCVNPSHLRWATAAENIADKFVHGTVARGSHHGMAKLTSDQVLQIVDLFKSGTYVPTIANQYGVTRCAVYNIMSGKTWSETTGITFQNRSPRRRQIRKPALSHQARP